MSVFDEAARAGIADWRSTTEGRKRLQEAQETELLRHGDALRRMGKEVAAALLKVGVKPRTFPRGSTSWDRGLQPEPDHWTLGLSLNDHHNLKIDLTTEGEFGKVLLNQGGEDDYWYVWSPVEMKPKVILSGESLLSEDANGPIEIAGLFGLYLLKGTWLTSCRCAFTVSRSKVCISRPLETALAEAVRSLTSQGY